ncbi:MAG: hypothetical protein L0H84_16760 [Pseudonocardia sp.]|nr:hypothetical protein [Pseudonocardia sp.]
MRLEPARRPAQHRRCSVGGARSALDRTVEYLRGRRAFGQALLDTQALGFRIADMATELEAARTLLWRAAAALDAGEPRAVTLCAMAKRFATDTGYAVADQALRLHGGYGYLTETGIEKIVRDLRVHQIVEGTNEIMRLIIARAVTDNWVRALRPQAGLDDDADAPTTTTVAPVGDGEPPPTRPA